MLGQEIPSFLRLPREGKIALIEKDNDIVLIRYLKANWHLHILTYSSKFSTKQESSRECWKFFQKITHYMHLQSNQSGVFIQYTYRELQPCTLTKVLIAKYFPTGSWLQFDLIMHNKPELSKVSWKVTCTMFPVVSWRRMLTVISCL